MTSGERNRWIREEQGVHWGVLVAQCKIRCCLKSSGQPQLYTLSASTFETQRETLWVEKHHVWAPQAKVSRQLSWMSKNCKTVDVFAVWCEQEKPWLLIRMFVLQLASRDVDQCVRTLGFEIGYDTTGHRAPVSLPLSFRVSNGQVGMRGRQQDRRTREGGRGE
jgi:hypothetical protein